MITFEDLERQDARKRKALKNILRKLTPISSDTIINDIISISKEGLKEKGFSGRYE